MGRFSADMGEGAGMDVEAEDDDALSVSKAVEAFEGVYKGSAGAAHQDPGAFS